MDRDLRYDPFDEFESLFDRVGRVWNAPGRAGHGGHPPVDVVRDGDDAVVTVDLPGYDREGIDVSVAGRSLTVRADHEHASVAGDGEAFLRRERRHESVARTIGLPVDVDPDGASADHRNGVLTVRLPVAGDDGHRIDVE
jgi:HSP20 family protein